MALHGVDGIIRAASISRTRLDGSAKNTHTSGLYTVSWWMNRTQTGVLFREGSFAPWLCQEMIDSNELVPTCGHWICGIIPNILTAQQILATVRQRAFPSAFKGGKFRTCIKSLFCK